MTEFLWFFGASGAGKASLIEEVAAGKFSLTGLSGEIIACRESLEFGRQERRDMLEEQLGKYATRDGTVLIKGQNTDLVAGGIPYRLDQSLPDVIQRIVYVYTRPELLPQRTASRDDGYWPNTDHDFKSETAYQVAGVEKLCETLGVLPMIVDNSGAELELTSKSLSHLQT